MKNALKYLAFFAAVAALGWVGMYLHWHFRIVGAVQTLATQAPPLVGGDRGGSSTGEANDVLLSAGCRALPYMVGAFDRANNPEMMCDLYLKILGMSLPSDLKSQMPSLEENKIFLSDSREKRAEKSAKLRAWWDENAPRIHKGWKVWSDQCASE
jgi:hypothetical protein